MTTETLRSSIQTNGKAKKMIDEILTHGTMTSAVLTVGENNAVIKGNTNVTVKLPSVFLDNVSVDPEWYKKAIHAALDKDPGLLTRKPGEGDKPLPFGWRANTNHNYTLNAINDIAIFLKQKKSKRPDPWLKSARESAQKNYMETHPLDDENHADVADAGADSENQESDEADEAEEAEEAEEEDGDSDDEAEAEGAGVVCTMAITAEPDGVCCDQCGARGLWGATPCPHCDHPGVDDESDGTADAAVGRKRARNRASAPVNLTKKERTMWNEACDEEDDAVGVAISVADDKRQRIAEAADARAAEQAKIDIRREVVWRIWRSNIRRKYVGDLEKRARGKHPNRHIQCECNADGECPLQGVLHLLNISDYEVDHDTERTDGGEDDPGLAKLNLMTRICHGRKTSKAREARSANRVSEE